MNAVATTSPTDGAPLPGFLARRSQATHETRSRRVFLRLTALGVLLGGWWLVTVLHVWSDIFVPPPSRVWHAFVQSVTVHDGRRGLSGYYLWQHLWASFKRILTGVFWAFVAGVPLGIALATWRSFQIVAEPLVTFVRSLPPLAYFSLLIIWFGIDDTSKVWLLFLAAFAPIALATAAGVHGMRAERVNAALVLGANRWQVIRYTLLPSILPDVITGTRLAVGFAWTTIVAAETSNGIPGIGGLAWSTKSELRTDIAVVCIIVIGLTAWALDRLLVLLQRRFAPWHGRA